MVGYGVDIKFCPICKGDFIGVPGTEEYRCGTCGCPDMETKPTTAQSLEMKTSYTNPQKQTAPAIPGEMKTGSFQEDRQRRRK